MRFVLCFCGSFGSSVLRWGAAPNARCCGGQELPPPAPGRLDGPHWNPSCSQPRWKKHGWPRNQRKANHQRPCNPRKATAPPVTLRRSTSAAIQRCSHLAVPPQTRNDNCPRHAEGRRDTNWWHREVVVWLCGPSDRWMARCWLGVAEISATDATAEFTYNRVVLIGVHPPRIIVFIKVAKFQVMCCGSTSFQRVWVPPECWKASQLYPTDKC